MNKHTRVSTLKLSSPPYNISGNSETQWVLWSQISIINSQLISSAERWSEKKINKN